MTNIYQKLMASIHQKLAVATAIFPISLLLSVPVNAASLIGVSYSFPEGDVIKIDPTTGSGEIIRSSGFPALNSLARDSSGRFFSITDPDPSELLIEINPETGQSSKVADLVLEPGVSVRGLAFSPNDVLFAFTDNVLGNEPRGLYTIDINTGVGTLIGGIEEGIQGLDFSPNGTLYGWNVFSGLVTINPLTGLATDINKDVGGSADIQTIAFAPDGTLFGAGKDSLFTINQTTGISTLVGSGDYNNIRGIEFVPEAQPKPVPEPSSILGLGAAFGLGTTLKKKAAFSQSK